MSSHRGGQHGGHQKQHQPQVRKPSALDLQPYLNKQVVVKFVGGRQAIGTLRGYDPLTNLVLDNATEQQSAVNLSERVIGKVVCRGTAVIAIAPADQFHEIENPFMVGEEGDE